MWANAKHDGHPVEYRRRPLFNAAKFGWCPLLECHAVTLTRRETRWNLQECPKLVNRSQPLVGRSLPYCNWMLPAKSFEHLGSSPLFVFFYLLLHYSVVILHCVDLWLTDLFLTSNKIPFDWLIDWHVEAVLLFSNFLRLMISALVAKI